MNNPIFKPPIELSTTVIADSEKYLSKRDKRLAKLIQEVGPCTLATTDRPKFEVLIASIISQQLSAKASTTIFNRLIECAGSRKYLAEKLVKLSFEQIRSCGISTSKTNAIMQIAELVATKQLDLDILKEQDDEAVHRELTAISGIGSWTVQMFLIFALRRPDIFSTGDAGLRRSMQKLYELQEKPTEIEMLAITERWRPYRTIGAWYLWRLID